VPVVVWHKVGRRAGGGCGVIIREERIGGQRLILGDSRLILPTLERHEALIGDPPYGIGFSHGAGGDGIGGGRYVSKFNGVKIIGDEKPFDPTSVLQVSPIVVLWGANHFANLLPSSSKWLVWDKRRGLTANDFADCEMAWTNQKGVARLLNHYWNGMMRDSERAVARVHPTQKPIALMEWCINQFASAQTILDPWMGSGTTLVACQRLGRSGTGIELDPDYFAIACKRVDEAARQPDLFVEPVKPQPVQEPLI